MKKTSDIRSRLIGLAKARSRHYDEAKRPGEYIPREALKRRYIGEIITRAEAAERYSHEGMLRLVIRLKPKLREITPDHRSIFQGLRANIQHLVQDCEREYSILRQPTLL